MARKPNSCRGSTRLALVPCQVFQILANASRSSLVSLRVAGDRRAKPGSVGRQGRLALQDRPVWKARPDRWVLLVLPALPATQVYPGLPDRLARKGHPGPKGR